MANPLDVPSRLAEGRPAVEAVEEYVAACRRLGYLHPDLTASDTQVRDWYAGEDGLDLRALDGDCAVLATVAAAAEDAARSQNQLVATLSAAWSGRGAAAARDFAWRSGEAATSVGEAVRRAADAAAELRDALWYAVDAKVAAVEAIDGRHGAQRAQWLAAARTVTTGAGDLAAASEMIDQQVKPFVHNDIGTEWIAAMRAATASIDGAYDASLAATTAGSAAVFDVPGDLGPRAESPDPAAGVGGYSPPPIAQAFPAATLTSAPMPAVAAAAPPQPVQPAAAPWTGSPPAAAPFGDLGAQAPIAAPLPSAATSMPPPGAGLGAGTSSLGSGLSGFGQQLADLIGALVGSADGGLPDAPAIDDPGDVGEPDDTDESKGPGASAVDDPACEASDDSTDEAESADAATEPAAEITVDEPPSEPAPAPTPVPPPPEPPPVPPAVPETAVETGEPTPCEIAADELPQVGE